MTATALEHPDMGAHECLARAVAASNAREDVRAYSPLQHALGRAPDLDGRFYTPEYEALPTVQAELVDETYGNNIKRMQDSEVNFLRWAYQNRVSRALNSKNRKAQIFVPGTYVYYWRKDKREAKGSFVLLASSMHRNKKRQRTRRLHRTTSPSARSSETRWMCVAQSSRKTDEGRPDATETRFCERGSISGIT